MINTASFFRPFFRSCKIWFLDWKPTSGFNLFTSFGVLMAMRRRNIEIYLVCLNFWPGFVGILAVKMVSRTSAHDNVMCDFISHPLSITNMDSFSSKNNTKSLIAIWAFHTMPARRYLQINLCRTAHHAAASRNRRHGSVGPFRVQRKTIAFHFQNRLGHCKPAGIPPDCWLAKWRKHQRSSDRSYLKRGTTGLTAQEGLSPRHGGWFKFVYFRFISSLYYIDGRK